MSEDAHRGGDQDHAEAELEAGGRRDAPCDRRRSTEDRECEMQVTILGATGRIGSPAMTEALARGHDLILLSRRPPTAPGSEHVSTIIGDVTDPDALRLAVSGSAAVIAALGPRTNTLED
ncbi:MAG: NAD(P)H-binding protein, partial [Actinomycetota bacterium]